jgi:hypothetical protein
MPWATVEETVTLTGVTVSSGTLAQAQGVLDLFSGVTEDVDAEQLSTRDRRLLRQACAYQAAWMHGQIDVPTRTDVSQLNQDGLSFTVANPDALVLAPLARRALAQLSWRRPGTSIRLRRDADGVARFRCIEDVHDAFLTDDPALSESMGWHQFPRELWPS